MKYLTLYRPTTGEEGGTPDAAHMAEMGALIERMTKAGSLISTEPLTVRAAGARVRQADGTVTVTDEAQRMGGYAFLQAGSRTEAIELAREFLKVAGDGEVEIRQVLEFGPG